MRIKVLIILSLLLTSLSVFSQGDALVDMSITINDKEVNGQVYLEKVNDRGFSEKIDSTAIKGEPFLFKTRIPEPGIYQLNIANEQLIGLLLDGGENLTIEADGRATDEKPASAMIGGSLKMQIFNEVQSEHFVFNKKVQEINEKFQSATKDDAKTKLRNQYLELLKEHDSQIIDKIKSLGTSATGVLATNNFLNMETSFEYFDELATQLVKEKKTFWLAQIFIQTVNQQKIGRPGVEAPDFTVKDLEGNLLKLSDLKGKRVILDFWATWCGPCIMSFPGMKIAMDKYKDREDVAFVFINTFERVPKDQTVSHVSRFIKNRGLEFLNPVLDENNSVAALYGVGSIPTRFFIGEDGKFLHMSRGYAGSDEAVVKEVDEWFGK